MTFRKPLVLWDRADPVANAILDLIEAQQAVQNAFDDFATGGDNDEDLDHAALETAVDVALEARTTAVTRLVAAELAYWRDGLTGVARKPGKPRIVPA